MGGTHCTIQRQQMDKKSDRVDTTRMDKMTGETKNKMESSTNGETTLSATWVLCGQDWPVTGVCGDRQGVVPRYGVIKTLVVNSKILHKYYVK